MDKTTGAFGVSLKFFNKSSWIATAVVLLMAGLAGNLQAAAQNGTVEPTQIATVTGTATVIAPITKNSDWTPQFQDFNGVPMALVPPGCFIMGSADGLNDEKPTAKICFGQPFWIDKTEVTQAQFKQFSGQASLAPNFSGDNRPIEQITWLEARDYCAKREARLPTEAEWEYAARGPDNLVYPWGNSFDGSKLVYKRTPIQGTMDVGSFPGGASWIGALDISGNVWEWASSIYKPYPYSATDGRESDTDTDSNRVLRGGSWGGKDKDYIGVQAPGRLAARQHISTSFTSIDVGLRCARSY